MMFIKRLFLLYFVIAVHSFRTNDNFDNALYNILGTGDKNFVYSPFGLQTLLALTYQGSAGHTELALRNSLGLPYDKLETAMQYKDVLKSLRVPSLDIVTKVYVRDSFRLKRNFTDVAMRSFLAETESLNMDNPRQAADGVNDWVKRKTHNKISQIIKASDLHESTTNVLLNAIYFKSSWLHNFNKTYTQTMPFYVSSSETVNCPAMTSVNPFDYHEYGDMQFLKLKFRDQRFSLLVVLSKIRGKVANLEEVIGYLNSKNSFDVSFREEIITVFLPRFKIESTHNLKPPLISLGLEKLFHYAELPHIIDSSNPISIEKVVQKATFEIDEQGGEASGATGLTVLTLSLTPVFKADHPFLFLLTAEAEPKYKESYPNGIILFAGKVTTPEMVL